MAGTPVTTEISHLLPRDAECLDQCLTLKQFYTFFLPGTYTELNIFVTEMARSEKFTLWSSWCSYGTPLHSSISPVQRTCSYYNAAHLSSQASYFRGAFPSDQSPTFLEGRHLSLYFPAKQQACQRCNKNICVQANTQGWFRLHSSTLTPGEYDIFCCLDSLHLFHFCIWSRCGKRVIS